MSSWSIIKWVGLFVAATALFFALSAPEKAPLPAAKPRAETQGDGSDSVDAPVLSKIERLRAEREVGEVGAALDNLVGEVARWDKMIQEHHASDLGKRLATRRVAVDRLRPFFVEVRPTSAVVDGYRQELRSIQAHLTAMDAPESEYSPGKGVLSVLGEIGAFAETNIGKFKTDYALFRRAVWELEELPEDESE
jgi:hypothetical protein